MLISIVSAAKATNAVAALHVLLGALTYGVVYTVWLKRRTWLNIVFGGLAGSFAVLAGASAVSPELAEAPIILAVVLFLWTPPHFWSLAFAYKKDYAAADVPMLPVVASEKTATRAILVHTVLLVVISLLPIAFGMGWLYLTGALLGGSYFVVKSVELARNPSRVTAIANFHASLAQLSLLLGAAILDRWLLT